ncbi:IclR family transcriptional regulator [Paenibacillaceae bacterium]|nr:IclR family transcriptional regulator [Paenibacillaceae bacterium]
MKDYKVPALEKGLEILETLSSAAVPMSLTDLSRTLGRSTSELYRMIGFLETKGYITKEVYSGNYHLSLKLYELAHTHSPVDQLIRAAMLPMREFAADMQESCHLGVLRNTELIVLRQEESPTKYRLSVEVGGRFDSLHTASGRLLIAYLPDVEREWFLDNHAGFAAMEANDKASFMNKLEQIRQVGYSSAEAESHRGVKDFAVLVGNPKIGLMASLAVPCLEQLHHTHSDAELLAALKTCAHKITGALGISSI